MTDNPSEHLYALIAQWEYQCCGDPIEIGQTVELTLTRLDEALPGPDDQLIDLYVEHHIPSEPMRHLRARVAGLWEWRVQRENRDGDGTWYSIAGTDEYAPIRRMEFWDEQWRPTRSGAQPEGWAIELDVLDVLEPRPDGYPYGV